MKITSVGHAGFFIETRYGSVLTDPWFNPAYFASWIPFPTNRDLDLERISNPDYLYVSHLHRDHFDETFLRDHVSKDTQVLLPDYPLDLMEREYRRLGFTNFVHTENNTPMTLESGLRIMIPALTAPTDGPLGDSGLCIDDGETRIFDQNDSRPIEFEPLEKFGPFDAHLLQFSGAIWYPMVYELPDKAKNALGKQKRANQLARALRYVKQIGATHIVPSAGPPMFLDDDLFHLNDFDNDESNIFPDQTVFIDYLKEHGIENGHLMIPGSEATLTKESCTVSHPKPDEEVARIFTDKRAYLEELREVFRPEIEAEKATWPRGEVEVLPALKAWFEPLLEQADLNCVGVNGRVLFNLKASEEDTPEEILIDFQGRTVGPYNGEKWDYRFTMDPALVEYCILTEEKDWINTLFLSCRFSAKRKGAYNEYVYNFFKVLDEERLAFSEEYYAQSAPVRQLWECGNFMVQRQCPHLKADLTRFGEERDGVLTCTLHGWQFDLETGECLTADGAKLFTRPVEEFERENAAAGVGSERGGSGS
ncbi:Rieske [2Fe-2S] domain [Rubrobacter radiotolerans]|uniref:Rieske 2Fe-2S domain-containing protein n=1 Tax=Rubrobacter radiotolerans TaxID=42256 RepID=A0A023X2X5_RUBRA|nr:Rieske 2Fe-2S domain-containing protein [Rubrobacter radiotolerans]AHY46817.1 Rieske [2Fe-2S] domain [Rubrobacter radiotolerans]MDX5894224.1 Rieske 2Fe-2S domain-containing protein [Rubrobacter radiotolerans]SMC05504.1 UDP-MurNAc hydroxylase [Rubrobacter radiotolerans DSM 5868]